MACLVTCYATERQNVYFQFCNALLSLPKPTIWQFLSRRLAHRKRPATETKLTIKIDSVKWFIVDLHASARAQHIEQHFTGEKSLRMRRDINHVVDFRQSHWLRGEIPAKHCQDERKNGRFFLSVVVLWFCCHCERSKIILVEIFSDMFCLVDNASWNCQIDKHTGSIHLSEIGVAIARCEERTC